MGIGKTTNAAVIANTMAGKRTGLRQRCGSCFQQGTWTCDRVSQMDPEHPPAALLQGGEITQRLGPHQVPEAVPGAGDVDVGGLIGGNLQEQAAIRPPLVQLPGGVQKRGTPAQRARHTAALEEQLAEAL